MDLQYFLNGAITLATKRGVVAMHRLVDRSTGTGAFEKALRTTTIKATTLKGRQHNGALYAVLRATKPDH